VDVIWITSARNPLSPVESTAKTGCYGSGGSRSCLSRHLRARESGFIVVSVSRSRPHGAVTPLSACGPAFVYRLHDFLGPPHRVRDCTDCRRNSLPAIKLSKFSGSEDTGRDQQHAFAALVHRSSLAVSLFVRYRRTTPQETSPVVYTCGIAGDREVYAVLWSKNVVRIARKEIVWDERNRRWETNLSGVSQTKPDSMSSACTKVRQEEWKPSM